MSSGDQLAAVQRAVLNLVIKEGKTYAEVAELMGLEPEEVKELASSALEAVGGSSTPTKSEKRPAKAVKETATVSAPQLKSEPPVTKNPTANASQTRSTLLLLLVAVSVAVAVIFALRSCGNDDESASSGTKQTSTSTTTASTNPEVVGQIDLSPPDSSSKALGIAQILASDNKRAITLVAEKIKPSGKSDSYAVWLYNSASDSKLLGLAPKVKKDGILQGATLLPKDISKYKFVVLTHENSQKPSKPSEIILKGKLDT